MKCYIFAYGTLCDVKVRKDVIGYVSDAKPSSLKGFTMSEIVLEHISYPVIVEDRLAEDSLEGIIFQIEEEDLQKLDAYETNAYRRIQITTMTGETAWTYILNES
ncbi:MAG: gamma-glutamylcyclotransferase [Bacteroidales bacterium]|nr:gamma-glutamylcyclotransferase [Bacteroidales bacterium]